MISLFEGRNFALFLHIFFLGEPISYNCEYELSFEINLLIFEQIVVIIAEVQSKGPSKESDSQEKYINMQSRWKVESSTDPVLQEDFNIFWCL